MQLGLCQLPTPNAQHPTAASRSPLEFGSWESGNWQLTADRILVVVGLALWLSTVQATPAHAQAQVEFIPSLSLFTIYDDNLFASVDGTAGQMLQLRPSFEGSYESPILRLLGLYSFDMQRSNFSTLNTPDARRHALSEARYRISPYTTLAVTGRYDRSQTPGDIDIETGVLGERRTAERLELAPTLARRLAPKTSISSSYNWMTENLVDGERGTMHMWRMGASHDLTPRTAVSGTYVGRYFLDHVDHLSDHQSHALLFAWSRELAPGTRLTLSAGPKVKTYGGTDAEASASFTRTTPRSRLAYDYWHGETIVLGVTGPVTVDSGTSRMSWPFTRRFELATHLGLSDITTIDGRDSTIYRGTLVGSWTTGGLYTFSVSYGADYQQGSIRNPVYLDGERLIFDEEVLRHVFRVSVTVAPRYKRSILPPDEAARAKGAIR